MNRRNVLFPAVLLLAVLGGGAWWMLGRPTPLEKARKAMDQGDPAAAVEILLKRLDKGVAMEEADLRRELARAYLMKGAYDNAETVLRALLEKHPDDFYGNLSLGFLFFSRGQDSFAVDFFRKTKSLEPRDLRASRALVSLFNFRGDFVQARTEALDVLNRAPDDSAGRLGLGRSDLGRGLFADAVPSFEAVLAASPADRETRRLLVEALLEAGEFRRAEESLAPLFQRSPDDPAAMELQARFFQERSFTEQAETIFRTTFEKDPRRLLAGISLAKSLAHRRETDAAQTLLLDIAQRLPKIEDVPPPPYSSFFEPWENLEIRKSVQNLRVHFHLAMAEVHKTRYLLPDAEREVLLALQLFPRSVDALRSLTEIKRAGGDAEERLKTARSAADLFPDHPGILLDLAQALLAVKHPSEALTYAQASAAACPSLSRAHAVLAEIRVALGEKQPAAEAAGKALALNDRDPGAFLADGLAKANRGEWKNAEAAFGRALDLDRNLARAHWERARALKKLKKIQPARFHREKAVELEPRVYAGRP